MESIFKMNFKQSWNSISLIRKFIAAILSEHDVTKEAIQKISVASTELLENAFKNSAIHWAAIEVERDIENTQFIVKVKNITEERKIEEFKKIFQMVKQGDAKDVYKNMMIRKNKLKNVNQLGLARIRYECDADLTFDLVKEPAITKASVQKPKKKSNDSKLIELDVNVKIAIYKNS